MKAVVFGAGKIGRGFLGHLLFGGGYDTTFADADAALVSALEERREYPLRLVGLETVEELTIGRVRAISAGDIGAVAVALAAADVAVTAVGTAILPRLMPALAAGIEARRGAGAAPLNVLLCENQWHAASLARALLWPHLSRNTQDYAATHVGLVETVIGRMVPAPPPNDDPLFLVAEPYAELPVSRAGARGPLPNLPGLVAADNFEAYEARKLYLHNAGHAALAYLGHARGHQYVWQCAADPAVAATGRAALAEAAQALAAEYGFDPPALQDFHEDLMRRFANQALGDTVARVAADPIRKLRPDDRLIGAARLCEKHRVKPRALAHVIAAALRYEEPNDPSAARLQLLRQEAGDAGVLERVCGLARGMALFERVLSAMQDEKGA